MSLPEFETNISGFDRSLRQRRLNKPGGLNLD
jgi:hypothetical protein